MVINFNAGDLFQKEGLYNEVGLLKERWAQDGSTLINVFSAFLASSGDVTAYTVTSGKTLYVSQITIICYQQFTLGCAIKDNATTKLSFGANSIVIGTLVLNFGVPLQFDTSIVLNDWGGNGMAGVTIVGWEE